jgi:hypothetical protein
MADNTCRIMETRKCPYPAGCGARACARFQSDDEAPWSNHVHATPVATDAEIEAYHKDQRTFPPGCTCERINVDQSTDVPGSQWVRGMSDPPCKVHLPKERALYDVAYERGFQAGGGLER